MALIGRQESTGAFAKLDSISSGFNGSNTSFNLTLGGRDYFAVNPYTLLVSLGGIIQQPLISFTIVENRINFAAAPPAGTDSFIVVLATTNVEPLRSLTIAKRSGAHNLDLHGRTMAVKDRSGTVHPIGFNLA
tara:strand:+ start:7950 stop:8348 length:399 start_codon:yes stop_codon:yes gene_type:complete